jgi:hypothetical protein
VTAQATEDSLENEETPLAEDEDKASADAPVNPEQK